MNEDDLTESDLKQLVKQNSQMVQNDLTESDLKQLAKQNSRMVSEFKAEKLEKEAKKNWDIFYKRNETKFFKDRHWTTREFEELVANDEVGSGESDEKKKILLEVGCGVGNFAFPLIEDSLDFFIYCCDFSPRAVEFVQNNPLYDEERIKAFQCDITTDDLNKEIVENCVDIVSMIFVLSAIHPQKHATVFRNIFKVLSPGGILLFRDYGLYDMAMIRFGPGSKIQENMYSRQDGTRSYFFKEEEMEKLAEEAGFQVLQNSFVSRRTVNKKDGLDVPRNFVQSKFRKPM